MKSLSASTATDPHYCCIYCATYEITECQYSHRSSLVLYILCYLWNHWVPVQPQILIIAVYTVLLMKSLSASAPQILIIAVYTVLPLKSLSASADTDPRYCCIYTLLLMKWLSASAATDPHYCCIYCATYEITECQCSHRSSLLLYILCYLWNHWVPVQPEILIITVYTVLLMKSLSASTATDPH